MGKVVTSVEFRRARDVGPERSSGGRLLWRQWPRIGVACGDALLFAAIGCSCWLLWHDGKSASAVPEGVGWRSPAISDSAPRQWRSPWPEPPAQSADPGPTPS